MSTDVTGVAGPIAAAPAAVTSGHDGGGTLPLWRDQAGPSFGDLLDTLNPLQHLPIISSLYRAITGDQIGHIPRVIGDTLFGGPVGMLMAGVAGMFKEASGAEPSEHLVALVEDLAGSGETEIASAEPQPVGNQVAAAATPVRTATVQPSAAAAWGSPYSGFAFQARTPKRLDTSPALSHTIRAADAERDRQRIVASIHESQRAQSKLLLSSVGLGPPADAESRLGSPARHPNLPPPEASPDWIAQAMDRGLRKYDYVKRAESDRPVGTTVNTVE
jgi:hypothetical protein